MSDAEIYRRKARELLDQAAATENLGERSRLITEAVRWHMRATEADEGRSKIAGAAGSSGAPVPRRPEAP